MQGFKQVTFALTVRQTETLNFSCDFKRNVFLASLLYGAFNKHVWPHCCLAHCNDRSHTITKFLSQSSNLGRIHHQLIWYSLDLFKQLLLYFLATTHFASLNFQTSHENSLDRQISITISSWMAFAFSMISFSEICRYERYKICPRLTNPLQNFCQREDAKEHNENAIGVYKVDAENDNLLSGHLLIEISKLIYSCLKADKFNTMYATITGFMQTSILNKLSQCHIWVLLWLYQIV